jgi:hypothetical protein
VIVYLRDIHLQPLPIFDSRSLQEHLSGSPSFVRYGFYSLTMSFMDCFEQTDSGSMESYADSARQQAILLAASGDPRVDVLQTLCMLALIDIKCKHSCTQKVNV